MAKVGFKFTLQTHVNLTFEEIKAGKSSIKEEQKDIDDISTDINFSKTLVSYLAKKHSSEYSSYNNIKSFLKSFGEFPGYNGKSLSFTDRIETFTVRKTKLGTWEIVSLKERNSAEAIKKQVENERKLEKEDAKESQLLDIDKLIKKINSNKITIKELMSFARYKYDKKLTTEEIIEEFLTSAKKLSLTNERKYKEEIANAIKQAERSSFLDAKDVLINKIKKKYHKDDSDDDEEEFWKQSNLDYLLELTERIISGSEKSKKTRAKAAEEFKKRLLEAQDRAWKKVKEESEYYKEKLHLDRRFIQNTRGLRRQSVPGNLNKIKLSESSAEKQFTKLFFREDKDLFIEKTESLEYKITIPKHESQTEINTNNDQKLYALQLESLLTTLIHKQQYDRDYPCFAAAYYFQVLVANTPIDEDYDFYELQTRTVKGKKKLPLLTKNSYGKTVINENRFNTEVMYEHDVTYISKKHHTADEHVLRGDWILTFRGLRIKAFETVLEQYSESLSYNHALNEDLFRVPGDLNSVRTIAKMLYNWTKNMQLPEQETLNLPEMCININPRWKIIETGGYNVAPRVGKSERVGSKYGFKHGTDAGWTYQAPKGVVRITTAWWNQMVSSGNFQNTLLTFMNNEIPNPADTPDVKNTESELIKQLSIVNDRIGSNRFYDDEIVEVER